jgi:hypothetical protein
LHVAAVLARSMAAAQKGELVDNNNREVVQTA